MSSSCDIGRSPVIATCNDSREAGRLAGGVIPPPKSKRLGVGAAPGVMKANFGAGVAAAIGVAIAQTETTGGNQGHTVASQHKESGDGNQGSATMQQWYAHTFNFASLSILEPDAVAELDLKTKR